MRNRFIAFFILLSGALSAQSWHWINPTTGINQINDIHFVSVNEGFAVGNQGRLLHYANGEWSLMDSPVNTDLFGISFVNPDMGWAIGANGTILRYQNGSWTQVTSPITGVLRDICCINENHCQAAGDAIIRYNGSEWLIDANLSGIETIGFLNESLGWAGGNSNVLYKYENGVWSADNSFSSGNYYIFNTLEKAGDVMLMNGQTIPQEGLLFENNGNGWVQVPAGSCNSGISFTDRQHGFGLQHAGVMPYDLYPTVHQYNEGEWQEVFVHEKQYQLFTAVEALSNTACMASDNLGYIHKIEDGSHSIANGFMYDSILDLQFVKPNAGFLAAHNSGLWKYNAGEWENIFNLPDHTIHVIDFQSEDLGYFGAYEHTEIFPFWPETKLFVYNSGVITQIPDPYAGSFITSLNIIGEDLVFTHTDAICTYSNGLITTETIAYPDSISDLKFMMPVPVNSSNRNDEWEAAWMSVKRHNDADSGVIFYKYFVDNIWQEVYETSSGSFNDLCIFGYNQVVAVGTNGLIAVFDGSNWSEIQPLTSEELLSVHLDENMNGWAVGRNGTMLECTGGAWSVYDNDAMYDLNVVSFYDQTLGFIGGNEGALLCTSEKLPVPNTYITVADTRNSLKIFPNPATETFTIELESPATNARIILTDPAGRLLMEKQLPDTGQGKQLVTMSASGLGSGIYLLTLIHENGVRTAKLVVR
ncbi:protein containing Por secretion system C-terminal sorting domain [Lentimicrobium saccharophilum]|uniref:Protein containing Por secretion system C-terminal sorting domain n=1 Tax=Lentimicrobium saccharophilum TaxID=1678841 RepID=A0A0S7C4E7_9BACT|nr:T9SS type A sorting domain-containing protein [Lentimicrobium saccharophilum]GAP44708.1 protein containing Por secretion system C-terminal sorting domain [Lentimicrobium saccharophilum]